MTTPDPVSDQERLEVCLKELDYLRAETLQKLSHHLQLFAIVPTALALVVTYILQSQKYDILYIVPILILPVSLRYLWEQEVIVFIGNYIRDELVKNRITRIVGFRNQKSIRDYDRYWFGYEHYWHYWEGEKIKTEGPSRFYYKYSALLLFVFIPIIPCLMYGSLLLSQNIIGYLGLCSSIPWPIHASLLIIYFALLIYLSGKFLNGHHPESKAL